MHVRSPLTASDKSGSLSTLLMAASVGLVVFVGLHVFFAMTCHTCLPWSGVHDAWWLNSRKSVEYTLVTLFLAAVSLLYRSGTPMRGAAAIWLGVLVGMILVQFATYRPDDMWPISLLIGGVLTAITVLFGMVVAVGFKAILKISGK